jgi:hypothetical protein
MKFVDNQPSDETLDLVWCEKCGQEFIGVEEDEDCYKLYIRKIKE